MREKNLRDNWYAHSKELAPLLGITHVVLKKHIRRVFQQARGDLDEHIFGAKIPQSRTGNGRGHRVDESGYFMDVTGFMHVAFSLPGAIGVRLRIEFMETFHRHDVEDTSEFLFDTLEDLAGESE